MALAGGLAALASFILLRGRYRKRAAAFAVSAGKLQFLFDHAPVAVVVTDMSPHVEWLAARRKEGVTDIPAYLRTRPEELRAQFARLAIVAVNRTALQLSGLRDIEQVRAELETFAPDFAEAFAAELAALWDGRHELTHNVTLHRRDGHVLQAILQWTVPVEQGRPDFSRVMSVFTDVTDLRRTQAKLRQSEDRWELAVRGINAGIWEIDFASGRFFVSARSRALLGYAPGALEDSRAAGE